VKQFSKAALFLTTVTLVLLTNTAGAQSLRDKLSAAIETASQNQLQIVDITETPLSNIYRVELSTGEMLYADAAGDYLFAGDMYKTSAAGLMNLSAGTRSERTVELIAAVPEDEMIIFTPETATLATITVFTDVDCTYCRKLHGDIEALLARGVQIRYMAYPRGGANADSYDKMISVWCSDDRHKSLAQAKNGQNLPTRGCENPVLKHHAMGNQLGITGTPALVMPDGTLVPGYMDVDRLTAMLNLK
jgi:thiol:disulfide interchange protein DsbC|tara:strand:+ start:7772 stop:8512 length:741 start_codon:yes stop_codon:yes gene_type:complete